MMRSDFQTLTDLENFYKSQIGIKIAKVISDCLHEYIRTEKNHITFLGYVEPFLEESIINSNFISRYIKKEFTANINAQQSSYHGIDATDLLPIKSLSQDIVISSNILEYSSDPNACVHEIWRILSCNGDLLLITPNKYDFIGVFENTPFEFSQRFTPYEISTILKEHNFYINQIQKIPYSKFLDHSFPTLNKMLETILSSMLVIHATKKSNIQHVTCKDYIRIPIILSERN